MKIFLDVDNTIVEHYGFYEASTESRVHKSFSRHPKENVNAIKYMYESSICHDPKIIRELFAKDDVYILTKSNSLEYEEYKVKRVAQIFEMTSEELLNAKDNDGNNKYILVKAEENKSDIVKKQLNLTSLKDCILIDDFSNNIIEWENRGGIGIKYYNTYNSNVHPTNGLAISNFKIFNYFLTENRFDNLLLVANNRYKLKELNDKLSTIFDYEHIDFLKIVYDDLMSKIKVEEIVENSKYSHFDFIVEYYYFINNVHPTYWSELIKEKLTDENPNVITSTFEVNLDDFKHLDKLSVKINSREDKKKDDYDVYITLNEERYIGDISKTYKLISKIFDLLIN